MCNLATKNLEISEFSFSVNLFFLSVVEDPKILDPNISYRTFLSTTILSRAKSRHLMPRLTKGLTVGLTTLGSKLGPL